MSPQVGWLCVFSGEEKTFSECIACSKTPQHCEFSPEMLIGMKRGISWRRRDPDNPSITVLGGMKSCPRAVIIKDRFDYYTSPRRNWFLFRGNIIHGILEGVPVKEAWKELMNHRTLRLSSGKEIEIWGKVDKIVLDKKLIIDYKTTRRVPKSGKSYANHTFQLNAYRWIWWPIFQAEKLRIQYLDMSATVQVKIPLMDIDEIEDELRSYGDIYYDVVRAGGLPKGEYNSSVWVCRYCDVPDICKKQKEEEESGNTKEN